MNKTIRTKSGAASMYVVIFTTLLLSVITISFIRIIMSEALNTTNSELSDSAYDSAMAGIEDAKLAVIKYHDCVGQGTSTETCNNIINYMHNGGTDCGTVAKILGRPQDAETGEVNVKESTGTSATEMLQAYTCVTVTEDTPDYRSTLNATTTLRIVPLISANTNLTGIRVSWFSSDNGTNYNYRNSNTVFYTTGNVSTPPMIAVQLLQTNQHFQLSDFTSTVGTTTDRGTVFLAPNKSSGVNYIDATSGFLKSNNQSASNSAFSIKCNDVSEGKNFACTTAIQLPAPVVSNGNSTRGGSSFLVVSLPYGQPSTDFAVELCVDRNGDCELDSTDRSNGLTSAIAYFSGAQALVDSTGRANDIYSRVEARIELVDIYFPYPEYTLQLSDSGTTLEKNFWVTDSGSNCWYANNGSKSNCSATSGGV